jgi:hypothetical protein
MASTPFSRAYDAAIEAAIVSIRAGNNLVGVTQNAVAKLREGFPGLTQEHVNAFAKDVREAWEEAKAAEPPKIEESAITARPPARARAIKWMRGNIANVAVFAYALFVVGSLFCVPWSYLASGKIYWSPIFDPPTTYGKGARVMFDEILLVWGAFGVLTAAIVWVAPTRKGGQPPK